MKKVFSLMLILCLSLALLAQRPLGTWQSFFPYANAIKVVNTPTRIYCATLYTVYYVEKSDGSIYTLDKSKGLSDAGISQLAYHAGKNVLIIAYINSNIDILVNDKDIYNVAAIKIAQIGSSKSINDIAIIGDYAYLATDIGISVLDLDKYEIKENYNIGITGGSTRVYSLYGTSSAIYAATAEGLKSASRASLNLQNFAAWKSFPSSSLVPSGEIKTVTYNDKKLYVITRDSLFYRPDGVDTFAFLFSDASWNINSITTHGTDLYLAMSLGDYGGGRVVKIDQNQSILRPNYDHIAGVYQIVLDGSDTWIADRYVGLNKYQGNNYITNYIPDGPPENLSFKMATDQNSLYIAPIGTNGNYTDYGNFNATGPTVYRDGRWKNYSAQAYKEIENCWVMVDVAVDAKNDKTFYATLYGGVIEQDNTTNALKKYDANNSILKIENNGCLCRVKTSALCVDKAGNLWIYNCTAPQPLILKTVDGTWKAFSINDNQLSTAKSMIVDDYGNIWITGRESRTIVYNPGTDLLDPSDDQQKVVSNGKGSGGLSNTTVNCLANDKNGDIWAGTAEGISTFYCASSIFTPSGCDADRIKVDKDGYIGYLFATENVITIAVDGANRKWVGTTNGAWLISEDGKKELLHFNTDNSPLPTNSVLSIAVNNKTGEVFIATESGLVSYMGDAILGEKSKGSAIAFPNPVKPSYTGNIAIRGLVDNAYVKITDAAGILVYQGKANGGEMIWDGKGYNGNRVSTGVYLVYAATDLGKEHNVAKIIFVN